MVIRRRTQPDCQTQIATAVRIQAQRSRRRVEDDSAGNADTAEWPKGEREKTGGSIVVGQ